MQNGSLLLFAFFMITDPKTTPNAPVARIIWSMLVGVITFVVTNWLYFHTAPIWVLFFIAPLTVLFDRFFKHKPFQW
jgi:Na+-translocating ferredoxin:NAD+ oxidoreductase RnfD subunit